MNVNRGVMHSNLKPVVKEHRDDTAVVASALATVRTERAAVDALEAALQQAPLHGAFCRAVDAIAAMRGRVIVTGIGKSGIVARKIAATFMSTGTPAAFLHPGEARHGDLGMITADDVVLAISWSGDTVELAEIIAYSRQCGIAVIVMTSRAHSTAGRAADICLPLPAVQEACPNRLAPTSSTSVQVILGDALAVALIGRRGFSVDDFRRLHPGGQIGATLLRVDQVMGIGDATPVVTADATLMEATVEMTRKRYGCTAVVEAGGRLAGVFTDGDLRRSFGAPMDAPVGSHMTPLPLAIAPHTLASEALRIMNHHAVSVLFVCEDETLLGLVHLHDVLRADIA